jgi:uncharacterized protein
MTPSLITFTDLPSEGRVYSGELRPDPFALAGKYDPIFVPPLRYEVTVRLDDGDVIVEGTVSARFQLQCSHCPSRLLWDVTMDPYFTCEEKEGDTLDLTAQLREDILLALPGYPRCEESNVEPHPCQTEGAFAPESDYTPLTGEEPSDAPPPDIWKALDRLSPDGPTNNR